MKKIIILLLILIPPFVFAEDEILVPFAGRVRINLTEEEKESVVKLTKDEKKVFTKIEEDFLKSEEGSDISLFINLVKIGMEDTIRYAMYPSKIEKSDLVWNEFLNTSILYIQKYEKGMKRTTYFSSDTKLTKNGAILFEIYLLKYLEAKVRATQDRFPDKSKQVEQFLLGEESIASINYLIRKYWLKEQIEITRGFWSAVSIAVTEVTEELSDKLTSLQVLYQSMVSDISYLPPKK